MNITKFTIQACCGRTSIIFKTDQPLSIGHLASLSKFGFNEHPSFTKAGILYTENTDFIITGPVGSNRLQVKCKKINCENKINDLEELLKQL